MIHVLLNTTVFRQDPQRKKASFHALSELGKSQRLSLHIPYIVQKEFIGYLQDEYLENLDQLKGSLAKLVRKNLPASITESLKQFQSKTKGFDKRVFAHLEKEFSTWTDPPLISQTPP
jgi:hypothetical protein